jgi:hypothetical protein
MPRLRLVTIKAKPRKTGSFGHPKREWRPIWWGFLVGFSLAVMTSSNATVAASSMVGSSSSPHPRLTALKAPEPGTENHSFNEEQREALIAEADECLSMMKGKLDVKGELILDERATVSTLQSSRHFVAAALALLCGRFTFKGGKPKPTAAAEACGKQTKNPQLVIAWLEKLERLEAVLEHEEAQGEQKKRAREDAHTTAVLPAAPVAMLPIAPPPVTQTITATAEDPTQEEFAAFSLQLLGYPHHRHGNSKLASV